MKQISKGFTLFYYEFGNVVNYTLLVLILWAKNAVGATFFAFCNYVSRFCRGLLDMFQSCLISVHWWDEGGWENQPPVRIPPDTHSNLHQACPVESAILVSPWCQQMACIYMLTFHTYIVV